MRRFGLGRTKRQVNESSFVEDEFCHDACGGWGEKDPVAIVAGGNEVIGLSRENSEERKAVGGCGT